jgi:hypothetical protein
VKADTWSVYDQISVKEMKENIQKWDDNGEVLELSSKAVSSKKLSRFSLFGQENKDYCAPAVGQMIADYYNVDHTQNYIAGIMGNDPGVDLAGQMYYYFNELDKTDSEAFQFYWTSGQWQYVKDTINSKKPFVSAVVNDYAEGHARACAGWGEFGDRYLYIYDPSPINEGDIYWEAEWCRLPMYNIYVK